MLDKFLEIKNPIVLITIGLLTGFTFYFRELDFIYLFILYITLSLCSIHFKKAGFILLGLSALFGYFYSVEFIKHKTPNYDFLIDKKTMYIGEVIDVETSNKFQRRYYLKIEEIIENNRKRKLDFTVLAKTTRYDDYETGDIIELKGKLKRPKTAILPGLFDERRFLSSKNIYYTLNSEKGSLVYLGTKERPLKIIETIRTKIVNSNEHYIKDADNCNLINGILVGSKASPLSKELRDKIRSLGLSHITSASGFNVSILCASVFFLLRIFFKRRRRLIPTLISFFAIIFYTALADFSSSIIRASIFLILALVGNLLEKKAKILPTISLTTILFFITNPLSVTDIGFQLSVFSFLGITLFVEEIKEKVLPLMHKVFQPLFLVTIESFFAQLLVLPILIFYFHNIQILGIISNLLAVPIASIMLIIGLINSAFLFIPIFKFILTFSYKLLDILANLFMAWVNLLDYIPTKEIFIPEINFYSTVLIYPLIILLFILIFTEANKIKITLSITCCIILIVLSNRINDTNDYIKIICFPKYSQEAILVLPPNKTPVFFGTNLNDPTKKQILHFLKAHKNKNEFVFYNLKDKTNFISNNNWIKDSKNSLVISHNGFNFEIIKNYDTNIKSASDFIKLPILMKKDPYFNTVFKVLPKNIIINDYKKVSKKSLRSLYWLKKQKTNIFLLSNSGTITIAARDKNHILIDGEN